MPGFCRFLSWLPTGPATILVCTLLAPAAAVAQVQSGDQQLCIFTANKEAAVVAKLRWKQNLACTKKRLVGALPPLTDCKTYDPAGKVAARAAKAEALIAASCTTPPNFGFTSAATVTSEAIAAMSRIYEEVFGETAAPQATPELKCAMAAAKAVGKANGTFLKTFAKSKKTALSMGLDSADGLASVMTIAELSNSVLATEDALIAKILSVCQDANLAAMDLCGPDFHLCPLFAERCSNCKLLTAIDDFRQNCDGFDDHQINSSCTVGTCGDGMKSIDELCDPTDPTPSNQVCPNSGNGLETCSSYDCTCACPGYFDFTPDPLHPSTVMDRGWTGLAHDEPFLFGATVTVAVDSCEGETKPCGVCSFTGPVISPEADQGVIANQRCTGNTFLRCDEDNDCTGAGVCKFFFGAPLPLSNGGVPICVLQPIDGDVTGTVDVATGESEYVMGVSWAVYNAINVGNPCPVCDGDFILNDGASQGQCVGGARDGLSCDSNGDSTVFGITSLDCPPSSGSLISGVGMPVSLDGSTAAEAQVLSMLSPTCRDAGAGSSCHCDICDDSVTPCASNADCVAAGAMVCGGPGATGTPTAVNECLPACDSGMDEGESCTTNADCDTGVCRPYCAVSGLCPTGPSERYCSADADLKIPCTIDNDCQVLDNDCPGDSCGTCTIGPLLRPCFPGSGTVGDAITAVGAADVPANESSLPTLAASTCIGHTSSTAVNNTAGLPGPFKITMKGLARALPQ